MERITYRIIESRVLAELIDEVNKCLNTSWELQGGIVVGTTYNQLTYFQTLVLKQNIDKR